MSGTRNYGLAFPVSYLTPHVSRSLCSTVSSAFPSNAAAGVFSSDPLSSCWNVVFFCGFLGPLLRCTCSPAVPCLVSQDCNVNLGSVLLTESLLVHPFLLWADRQGQGLHVQPISALMVVVCLFSLFLQGFTSGRSLLPLPAGSEPVGMGPLRWRYPAYELVLRKPPHLSQKGPEPAIHWPLPQQIGEGQVPFMRRGTLCLHGSLIMFFLPHLPEAPEPLGGVHCAW